MSLKEVLLGPPISTWEESEHRVKTFAGIPMLGLDALASAAYGPEAALVVLMPLGAMAIHDIGPITIAILVILGILYFSYMQTIKAYPSGGGAYTVATENLGRGFGLLAAAALLVDYALNAAVGISAGVGALISAIPSLHAYVLPLCLGILALITFVNLRGVRESGLAFSLPTYVFIGSMVFTLVWGIVKTISAGGHPQPVVDPPPVGPPLVATSLWLVLRAFSSGCTAMTGVEAVSNGVNAFQEPGVKYARRTLTAIVVILAVLLGGIAVLVRAYDIGAMRQETSGYQSVLSQLVAAVAGRGWFYYLTIFSMLAVLSLSANTSFADYPRLSRLLADDGFLPHGFGDRGHRLVFSRGIMFLAILAAAILIVFGGVTDRLIPLFAVGALGAFTLSQAGMVVHWKRNRERGWHFSMTINALGAIATGTALLVVLGTKFMQGAWITLLIVPTVYYLFTRIHRHYGRVAQATCCQKPVEVGRVPEPVVVVPIKGVDTVSERALSFALSIAKDVRAVCVTLNPDHARDVQSGWDRFVREPLAKADREPPRLTLLQSPVRKIIGPVLGFIEKVKDENPDRTIVVAIPELIEGKWYQYLLHNQRATVLRARLYFQGGRRVVVASVPWYLDRGDPS